MALTANDLITEAVAQYNDELQADSDYERIKIATWIKYLNSALRSLVLVRPDSNVTKGSIQLVAGTHQDIPTAAVRLMSITRNNCGTKTRPRHTLITTCWTMNHQEHSS
jgi:hypothetical protein